jgi:hypothetical protein
MIFVLYITVHQTIDYECLQKYDEHNEHFSMEVDSIKGHEQDRLIGYNCTYRYESHKIKLRYNTSIDKWIIVLNENHSSADKQLKTLLARINECSWISMGYTLDERIQEILKLFDEYLSG